MLIQQENTQDKISEIVNKKEKGGNLSTLFRLTNYGVRERMIILNEGKETVAFKHDCSEYEWISLVLI